jgi:TonB-dependent receptor
MRKTLFILVLAVITTTTYAQKGFLRGKILDKEFGDGLIGATVSKQGTGIGSAADFDGNYSLALDAGTHTIVFQFVSYQTITISDVVITEGELTKLDVEMGSASTELEEVVVTATEIRDTDIALLTVQKRSVNTVDGISSQTFRKVGDSDLGAAMKRVTGVSVQGGKYVYVRGLGDRYSKTTLNGMGIPGLDPDRNAVQIDIFPTNTIENVVVYKTFTPDLMGDFAGGIVDIETKSFPEEKTTNVSFGVGFNPEMHLRNDAITYDGGGTDFLGFDDGTRKLPFDKSTFIENAVGANAVEGAQIEGFTRAFDSQLGAKRASNFMNYNFTFNHGNQIDKEKVTIGYNAIFSYKKNEEYYDRVTFGETIKSNDKSINDLQGEAIRSGTIGNKDVTWNALVGGALKFENHSFSANILRTQNGISSAFEGNSADLDDNPSVLAVDVLTYSQRSVTSGMLIGKHNFDKFKVEWKGNLNWSRIYEPDFRQTQIEIEDEGTFGLNVGVGAGVDRFYRDLNETGQSFKFDVTYPFGDKNKLKAGAISTFKKRDFEVIEYLFVNRGDIAITEDPNSLLQSENIWTLDKGVGIVARGNGINPSKTFDARQSVFGAYVMSEMNILSNLKAIYGVRAEKVMMYYTGEDQSGEELDDQETLNALDILPSANLVYSLSEDMNLRGSYNRTLARPSFKEKSNAQIFDPISGRTFIGNLDVDETHISNFDVRWEYFFGRGEMVSFSGFYKDFSGHIEMISFDTAPDQVTIRNAGKSTVTGIEVEFRKNITNNLAFGTNASFVKSAIDMKEVIVNTDGKTEYELRQENLRDGETMESTRDMSGQAPYVVNGYLNISNNNKSINANISYNVQGETLNIVGSGRFPDIYTKSFHSLNLNVYKDLGADMKSRVTLGVNNILGAERENVYKSYEAKDEVYSIFQPGRTFTAKYSYTF